MSKNKLTSENGAEALNNLNDKLSLELITKLSHHVRTAANNILSTGNNLNNSSLDQEQKDMVSLIRHSAINLVSIINNVVEESNNQLENVNSNTIFDLYEVVEISAKNFCCGEIGIHISISKEIPQKIFGNSVMLKQILYNIIEVIAQNRKRDSIQIDITIGSEGNNGEKLKTKFVIECSSPLLIPLTTGEKKQLLTNRSTNNISSVDYIGSFGLKYTKKLINSYDGELQVIIEKDKSLFEFILLLDPSVINEAGMEQFSGKVINSLSDLSLLVVDDNPMNQRVIQLNLSKYVKKIVLAYNGKEALKKIEKQRFDLVLMDVNMPVMDGHVAAQKIREMEYGTNTHIPIIAITANALIGEKQKCYESGMDDYITKPIQIDNLIRKVSSYAIKNKR